MLSCDVTSTVAVPLCGAGTDADLVEDGAELLMVPAAPEPKSELRWTKPSCSATPEKPGMPLTAAATPETDNVAATVIAAMTPARVRVRLLRE